jgi:putative DNA primase/helicase
MTPKTSGDDVLRSSEVKPKKVTWLWRERIPEGALAVVAGKPDQGKGLFAVHVSAEVSQRGGNVLYSAPEDAHDLMTRPRLEAAGADLERVLLWRFTLPEQFEECAGHVIDNDVRLLILDPFNAHLGRGVSRHSDTVRTVTGPLTKLAEATGCSILIIEHALKRPPASGDPLASIGGSGSGLVAATRMGFVFGVDPEDSERRILCNVKSNLRERAKALAFETDTDELPIVGEVPSLILQGECEFDAMRLLSSKGTTKVGRRPDKRAAAAEWLTQYLAAAGKPVKAGEVIEDGKQHALAAKTVRRAADDMGVVKTPPGGGRNCTWQLPAEVLKALGVDDG